MDLGFDSAAMSFMGPPIPFDGVTLEEQLQNPLLSMDMTDHQSAFDPDAFLGSLGGELYSNPLASQHPRSLLKRYSSTFDEPFFDPLITPELQPKQEANTNDNDNPSIDRDNKLLSFSLPVYSYTLLDFTYQRVTLSISAQLHGMFFLAESPWASVGESESLLTELTCYRRNLFQITGTITIPRSLRYILTDQGEQVPILAQELCISAIESVEGNSVKIISVPWKTPAANMSVPDDKAEKEPPSMLLDLMNGQELDSEYASFPIAWKRLQFRAATANNGRRKELQQNFVIRLRVMATIATGAKIPICEVQSSAIIVRGRSPRNFQSRKDMPLSGAGVTSSRKSVNAPAQPARTSIGDSGVASMQNYDQRRNRTPDRAQMAIDVPAPQFDYSAHGDLISPDFFEWRLPTPPHTALPPISSDLTPHALQTPSIGAYPTSNPDTSRPRQRHRMSSATPVNLSLTDGDRSVQRKASSPVQSSNKAQRVTATPRLPSFSLNPVSSPDEGADSLYEYFPLGLEDWMPPVDAVYRPHVVHHTKLASENKAAAGKSRSKRYFSEDQPG